MFTWLTAGLFKRLAEKTVDVAVQQGLTAWQLRRLEHLCSPLLRCEAAQVNVKRPDVREPQGCSCAYHDLLNQWLRALATVLARVILLVGSCVLDLFCVDTPRPSRPLPARPEKARPSALRAKYGAP
jgi:hypothetical protein